MRVQAARRQSTSDSWPTSSILGPTSRRLGMALVAIGALWAGVLWVTLTPPREAGLAAALSPEVAGNAQAPQPEASVRPPQRVGLRALAMAGEPVGLNGSFDRFGLQLLTMVLASNNRGETAFYATIRRSQSEEGIFLAKADGKIARIAVAADPVPDQAGQLIAGFGERPAPVMNDAGGIAFTATLAGGRRAGSRRRLPRWLRCARRQRHGRRRISGRGQTGPGARCYLCRARRGARASLARYGRFSADGRHLRPVL